MTDQPQDVQGNTLRHVRSVVWTLLAVAAIVAGETAVAMGCVILLRLEWMIGA